MCTWSIMSAPRGKHDRGLIPTYDIATGTAIIRVVLKTETRIPTLISRTPTPAALARRSFRTLPKRQLYTPSAFNLLSLTFLPHPPQLFASKPSATFTHCSADPLAEALHSEVLVSPQRQVQRAELDA